jgi:hypothetical protein
MPPGIASNLTGALGRVLAASVMTVVFVFRCGDTLASTPLPVGGVSEIAQTEPTTVPSTEEPTSAPTQVQSAAPKLTPSPTPIPTVPSAPAPILTPSPTTAPTTLPVPSPTQAQSAAPTLTPSPTPIPTVPSTPSPIVAPSPIPTATPTQQPTATPTQQPTATPTQQPTATPTQRATATPTQKPNLPPQIERIGDQSGKVGQQFVIRISASDPDGDRITLSCGGADKLTDNGDGTGTLEWTGTKPGKYAFTCSASDGKSSSSTAFAITVD